MTEIVAAFDYGGDGELEAFCEGRAASIRLRMRKTVEDMAAIGRELEEVKRRLPHGRYGPWVEARFPGSHGSAERARKMARHLEQWPVLSEVESVEAALEIGDLEDDERQLIIDRRAFTWAAFQEARREIACQRFRAGVDRRMADEGKPYAERLGDVLHWTKDGLCDERIAPAAREVYEQYREEFARHSDREPVEVDAETGYRPEPSGQWAAHEPGDDLWICRRTESGWEPVARVGSKIMLWPGPRLALALPDDGPATAAWQARSLELIGEALPLRTLAEMGMYGEVL